MVNDRKEPACSLKIINILNNLRQVVWIVFATNLEGVRTAGLEVEGTQSPIFELPEEVTRTDALGEVKFTLPVEAQDVLKNPR